MADRRISQLPPGVLTLSSIIPIVSNGITSQTTFENILTEINNRAIFATGGTFDSINGITTITLNNGNSFNVTGYFTGYTYTLQDNVDKQNSMIYDGTGFKYPTVDTVNELANNIALASINTGFIDSNDQFIMARVDDNTLSLSASNKGIIFKSLLETLPFAPSTAIKQIPQTTINLNAIPLSGLGVSGDGIYIRFIGFNDNENITYSEASYKDSLSTAQLGVLILKVVGGIVSFLDSFRNVINKPSICNYSNLELLMLGLQSDVMIRPNSGTLFVNNTSGSLKGISVNWHGANNDEKLIDSEPITFFTHISQANALTPIPPVFVTTVTTDKYWSSSASSLVTLSTASAATIQRWLVNINGTLALQYGEQEYINLDTAKANISNASFIDLYPSETYVEIVRMVAIRDTIDLGDISQAVFIRTGGGGNGSSTSSVWGTINGNINNQTDLFATFLPIVDRSFINLGTATTGTTNINLSASTNFNLVITGDTNLNVIPSIDGTEVNLIIKIPTSINPNIVLSPNVKTNYLTNSIKNLDAPRDTTFNYGVGLSSAVYVAKQQLDGKLVLGGAFTSYNTVPINRILRLNLDGTIDNTFIVGFGANSSVYSMLIQSDGKIVIGGVFTQYNGITANKLARLNVDGSIDNAFNTNIGTGFNNTIYSILQESGTSKLIIAGLFTNYNSKTGIVRLNTDGTYDSTFNVGGTGMLSTDNINSATFQSDGKIVIVGNITQYNNSFNLRNIIRLNFNGTIDTSFSGALNSNTFARVFQQLDGKIVTAGQFNRYGGYYSSRILKLNLDGSIDTSFKVDGSGTLNNGVNTIALQSTGKPVAGGFFSTYSATPQPYIIRLNLDGTRDTTFNIGASYNNSINVLLTQLDDKILVGGTFTTYSGFTIGYYNKLNSDGTIDSTSSNLYLNNIVKTIAVQTGDSKILVGGDFTTFNNPSQAMISKIDVNGGFDVIFSAGTGFNVGVNTIIETSGDSKLIIGGNFTTYNSVTQNRIIRLNANGSRDTSFSAGTGFNAIVNTIIQQLDGKILAGGDFTQYSGITTGVTRIARLNLDGTRDITFNTGVGFNVAVSAITQQLDGKILVGGDFTQYSGVTTGITRLVRLNLDGTRDASLVIGTGFSATVNKIVTQTGDSKILVTGAFTGYSNTPVNRIVRLNTGGTIDNTFNIGTGFDNITRTIVMQPDNKVLVGGNFTRYNAINTNKLVKLNSDGSVDTTFSANTAGISSPVLNILIQSGDSKIIIGGQFVTQGAMMRLNTNGTKDTTFSGITTGFNSFIYKSHIQPDGKIIALGAFTTFNGVATRPYHTRLNTNGSIDNTYYTGTGFNNYVNSSTQQADGKIVVAGAFTQFSGLSAPGFARLNIDGTRDNTFNAGTGFTTGTNFSTIVEQIDGKILVGGAFSQYYSGVSANNFIRLNSDGTPDLTFNIGTGFNSTVNIIAQQPNGKILVGGLFTQYSGITANYFIRLNTDGTRDNTFNIGAGFDNSVYLVRLETDGTILVGGQFSFFNNITASRIIRLNSDGSKDNTFNSGTGGFNSQPLSFLQVSGTPIFVGGGFTSYSGDLVNKIARLNTDGTYDTSFSGNGTNLISALGNGVSTINVTNNNKIIIEGDFFLNLSGFSYTKIAKLNSDGNVDLSFPSSINYNNTINSGIITSDNKLVSVGTFTSSTGGTINRLIRLLSGGSIDTLFNFGAIGFNNTVTTVAMQPDNKIVVGGLFTTYNGITQNTITRLNIDGSLDTTFSGGNQVALGMAFNGQIAAITVQPDGNILVIGSSTIFNGVPTNRIIRLTSGGTIDNTFLNNSGIGFNGNTSAIKLQSDGKILVGGAQTSYNGSIQTGINRLNTDGTYDSTFNAGGIGTDNVVNGITQNSGSTFICGVFSLYNGNFANQIARINLDSSYDTTFISASPSGILNISDITQQLDGKLLFCQLSQNYNNVNINFLARLNIDGSIDNSFSNGLNISPTSLFVQTDGKLLIFGGFVSYYGVSANGIVRVNLNTPNTLFYKLLQYGSNIIIK